jgi:hypothetical protein
MKKLPIPILALTVLLALTTGAQAAPITYNVDLIVGDGSATGSITTNGSLGILSNGAIIDWDLLLDDGITTFTLDGTSNSERSIVGTGLVATSSELTFNFSGAGFVLFQNPSTGSGINYLCFAGVGCGGPASAINLATSIQRSDTTPMSGVQTIGVTATTPEPASLVLLSMGLVAVGGRAYRGRRGSR